MADIPALRAVAGASAAAGQWTEDIYDRIFAAVSLPRLILVIEEAAASDQGPAPKRRPQPVLLGFLVALCAGTEWELENLAVAPDSRRLGVGTRLLQTLLRRARRARAEGIFLEVRESNQAARGLYESAGFIATGRRVAYYSDPPEAAVVYRFQFSARRPS